ncbi:NAD(P)-dependent oxidoreductase [Phytomonospora sp. NPDC050363]|uniref:NAD(P)-dependent oxidoreductase n=1 Tax=Phytomonospora sp. NPDC050363 TaxID=3155642 RepID=UPI0034055E1B
MSHSEPTRTATRPIRSPVPAPSTASPALGVTVYGCGRDEAVVLSELAPRFGVLPTVTEAALTESNTELAVGSRCVSVGHKTPVSNRALLGLGRAGVEYVSTRSVGRDHIDADFAASVGITVGNVAYSPDSVADYTLMLMLMALRDARSMIRRTDLHDYRLSAVRGRELRDLTVGVIGTGRIGTAVMQRLRGFRCRTLAHNNVPGSPGHVSLGELLELSDIVTLHAPLTPETRHLLDRARIARMRPGAVVVNTGRGGLIDTEALIAALESGRLGGAALDVIEGEEGIFYADHRDKPVDNAALLRLQGLANVIVSPHTAYYTDHALRDTVENSLVNCVNFAERNQHG